MGEIASQITSLMIVYSIVYSNADQRKLQVPRHWFLCGEITGTGKFPAQMASYAENVSTWWRHHDLTKNAWDHYEFQQAAKLKPYLTHYHIKGTAAV